MSRKLKPVSTGEMLAEEFLKPLGMSNYRLAKEIEAPAGQPTPREYPEGREA